jgi:hypothetical protein
LRAQLAITRVPDANVDWGDLGIEGKIHITFFFDKEDKLLRHLTMEFADGKKVGRGIGIVLVGLLLSGCTGFALLVLRKTNGERSSMRT